MIPTPLLLVCAALADGQAPVAEAGLGVMAYVGDTVILNGTGSADPDGANLGYTWTQVGGPPATLVDPTTAKPSFEVPAPGTFRFSLVVSDGTLASPPDTVAIVVPDPSAVPLGETQGGCATVPAAPGLAGLLGLALVRRRRGA